MSDPGAAPGAEGGVPPSAPGPSSVPKAIGIARQLRGLAVGGFVILFALVVSGFLYSHHQGIRGPLIVLAGFGGFGVLLCVGSLVGLRQMARYKEPGFTHFGTGTATEYWVPLRLSAAVVGSDETIGNWFGPVNTRGKAGIGLQVIAREVDHQAINTLLFTQRQVVGVMLGPVDAQHLGTGPLKGLANSVVSLTGESAVVKGTQFQALNANHWGEMVAAMASQPLDAALRDHLTFGLPYSRIQRVEVEDHFVNPGFTFHLTDGATLRYGSFKRARLKEIATYLHQFVQVH